MSDAETITFEKSTDEGVTVEVAEIVIADTDSVEELEAFAGEEAADDDGRAGVKKAYQARKEELEAEVEEKAEAKEEPKVEEELLVLTIGSKEAALIANKLAKKQEADAEVRPRNQELNPLDAAFEKACKAVKKLADAKGKKQEVAEETYKDIVIAVAEKANKAREQRGMMQPSDADKALNEALEALEGWNPEDEKK